MGIGGGSVLPRPKMAEKRRTYEQTSTQNHSAEFKAKVALAAIKTVKRPEQHPGDLVFPKKEAIIT
jgi:hypothetical protein